MENLLGITNEAANDRMNKKAFLTRELSSLIDSYTISLQNELENTKRLLEERTLELKAMEEKWREEKQKRCELEHKVKLWHGEVKDWFEDSFQKESSEKAPQILSESLVSNSNSNKRRKIVSKRSDTNKLFCDVNSIESAINSDAKRIASAPVIVKQQASPQCRENFATYQNHQPPQKDSSPNMTTSHIFSSPTSERENRPSKRVSRWQPPAHSSNPTLTSKPFIPIPSQSKIIITENDADADNFSAITSSTFLSHDQLIKKPSQNEKAHRELFLGNIPKNVNSAEVHVLFRNLISKAMNTSYNDTNDPVVGVRMNNRKRFAFIEFRCAKICTACLAFDGMDDVFQKGILSIGRPNSYDPDTAPPDEDFPEFDIGRIGIQKHQVEGPIIGKIPDGPNKIYVSDLPSTYKLEQVFELCSEFGSLKKVFHKGNYCFIEYEDPKNTQRAIEGLDGKYIGRGRHIKAVQARKEAR